MRGSAVIAEGTHSTALKSFVEYPVFLTEKNSATINVLIAAEVDFIIGSTIDIEPSDGNLITYRITREDEKYISIVFDGFVYNGYSAHPLWIRSAITIDIITGVRVTLADIVTVDKAFIDVYMAKAQAVVHTRDWNLLEHMTRQEITRKLLKSDVRDHYSANAIIYLTPNYFVIHMPVAYVLGSFFDVELPYPKGESDR